MSNGTQLFYDNATRADENPLSDGAAWSAVTGYSALRIVSNAIQASATSTNCAMRVGTFSGGNDQYVEVVTGHALTGSDAVHVWVRSNSDRSNAYILKLAATGTCALIKVVANVATTLQTFAGVTVAAGVRYRLTVIGSMLVFSKDQGPIANGTVQDADLTTGLPGLYCFAATTANATVTEFRAGNPVGNVAGPWTKQGSIIHATTADINSHAFFSGISNQSAMYDDNPQLISPNVDGKVHKIWFMAGNAITYAESQTALPGSWTRQTVANLASRGLPRVYRDGSTYYAYVSHGPTSFTQIDVYTCTNGDNNWVLAQAAMLVAGAAGTYDATQCDYFSVVGNVAGTWYAIYTAQSNALVYSLALATAPALTGPWTKSASNPVDVGRYGAPEHMIQFGGFWYGWAAHVSTAASNIVRVKASLDLLTWTTDVFSLQPENVFEGIQTSASGHGAVSVPSVVEASGSCVLYYSATPSDSTVAYGYVVCVATAPYSMTQIINGGEEYFADQPVSFTDTFNRVNENPLGSPYTLETGSGNQQIVSNLVEPSALNSASRNVYTGASPALHANQFAEVTAAQINTGSYALPLARMAQGAITNFQATCGGPTGSNFAVSIARVVSGSATTLGSGGIVTVAVNVGDVYRIRAIDVANNGVLVSFYQNGNLVYEVTDFSSFPIATGNPGLYSFAPTGGALTDSQISKFRAGNADAAYVPGSVGGATQPFGPVFLG